MLAHEVARVWGGRLRPIGFDVPRPVLPADTVVFLHAAGLPRTFRLVAGGVPFVTLAGETRGTPLRATWAEAMAAWSMPVGWDRFWRIGELTWTQATAWLCLEELTGHVHAVDVEATTPVSPVATSVAGLARCLRALLDAADADGSASPDRLRAALAGELADEARPFWRPLVDEVLEAGARPIRVEHE